MFAFEFLDILFLVPLFLIGGICSYTDFKYGKIYNKWIIIGFFWGVSLYFILFFYNLFYLQQKANFNYFWEVDINTLISFVIGYLFWQLKLWSAGDAKLFILFSFLTPLKFYSKSYLPYFPSFNLLINLFIPLLLILIFSAFLSGLKTVCNKRYKLKEIKKLIDKKQLPKLKSFLKEFSKMFLDYIFIFILFQLTISFARNLFIGKLLSNPIFILLSMFIIFGWLSKVKGKKKWLSPFIITMTITYLLYLLFFNKIETLKIILKYAFIFMVLFGLLQKVLAFYIEKKEIKKIKVKDLREGTIFTQNSAILIKNELRQKGLEENFGQTDASGLSIEQVKLIKNLFASTPHLEIEAYKTFPFAPFLFLSVIFSLLTKSSFLTFFIDILK